jgi:hypothetical protein
MRHSLRHTEHRSELDGIDPLALIGIPLAILLLGFLVVRAIMAAIVV